MVQFKHVAVAGATGASGAATGGYVLDALLAKKAAGQIDSIRVLGRKPSSDAKKAEVAAIEAKGIPFHAVDYDNEEEVLNALKGSDVLVSCLGGPAIPDLELALFLAAKKAGVKRVLPSQFTSDLDVLGSKANPYHSLKAKVADILRTDPAYEGLEYTLVVVGIFMDLVFGGFSGWHVQREPSADKPDEAFIVEPFDARITGTSREDIGKFVAEIVADPNPDRTKNLALRCISAQWTNEEAIGVWEKASGRKVTVHRLTRKEADDHPKLVAAYGSGARNNFGLSLADEYYFVPEPWNGTEWYGPAFKPKGLEETLTKIFAPK